MTRLRPFSPGCNGIYGRVALRVKIGPDEAEAEGFGGSKVEADNEVWPDFRRNPKGRGHFSSSLCHSSLADTRYASLLASRSEKKWLPSLPTCICRYTLRIGIAVPAQLLLLIAAAPAAFAQLPAGKADLHDVGLAEYRAHLQALDSIVVACRAQVARKAAVPSSDNACDPDRVGSDDRVSGASAATPREVSYDWLRSVLAHAQHGSSPEPNTAIGLIPGAPASAPPTIDALLGEAQARLEADEKQASASAAAPANYASERAALNAILAQRAYQGSTQVSTIDRLREWFYNKLDRFLAGLVRFGSRSRWIVWTLRILLLLGISIGLVWAIVRVERGARVKLVPDIEPSPDAPSAREWQLWLADARAMAAKAEWREAIHLVYWAAIARLESRRMWPADRARTPREYLVLMPGADPRTASLTALTRNFERTWYGGRAAESGDFQSALDLAASLGVKPE
jgi:hypothetical protein